METTEVRIANPVLPPLQDTILAPAVGKIGPFCPWGAVKTIETVSLNDVMSEELAKKLDDENKPAPDPVYVKYVDDTSVCEEVTDCTDDCLLAKMLQLEYDKEHDEMLKKEETKYNGHSKLKISFGKYRCLPDSSFSSDEDSDERDDELELQARNHWQNFDDAEKAFHAVGKSGVSRQNSETTTKHDLTLSGRRNAGKLMELSPGISTGDGGKFDMKISNSVYSTLRSHSRAEDKRGHKYRDEREKSTAQKALDEKTHLILYKMVNNQTLDSLSGCVSTGKEACVYHAWSGLPPEESPAPEFAVKIFKTTLNEFQNREQYIKDDHRFRYRFSKQNPRKVIHMWAEKEMRNLIRMKEANIPCPSVVTLKKHVLVMTFIGKDMLAAPKVKDVDLPFADMTIMYEQTVEIMKTLYSTCKLVHADLSEFNLLWYEEKIYVIDVSQSVEITHSRALEFLLRDCTNVTNFFRKRAVFNVPSAEDLFFEICGQLPKQSSNISRSK